MKTSWILGAFLLSLMFSTDLPAQANSSTSNCADLTDIRSWKVVILSNYQSAKTEERRLAIEAAKKYIEKAGGCKLNDEFVPWLVSRVPVWEKSLEPASISTYDAELAKKLGADERGMRMYVMCILKTGPKDAEIKGKQREDIFAGHFANINRLADEGKLAVAGPFGKNERTYRGLYIFNVPTIEEAEKLVVLDPAVKAGVFVPEMTLWYGSASLMATPEIHKKLEKPKSN